MKPNDPHGPIRIAAIAHILLFVRDAEASARWYCDRLGMKITARSPDGPYRGAIFLSFGQSDHDLALYSAPFGQTGRELGEITLEWDAEPPDVATRMALWRREGMAVEEIRNGEGLTGLRLHDPDGRPISLAIGSCAAMQEGFRPFRP